MANWSQKLCIAPNSVLKMIISQGFTRQQAQSHRFAPTWRHLTSQPKHDPKSPTYTNEIQPTFFAGFEKLTIKMVIYRRQFREKVG